MAGLYVLGKNVKVAGDLEETLGRIGQTANMSVGQLSDLRSQLRQLSSTDETNQSVDALAESFKSLVSAGMGNEQASASLRAIGRTATATGAGMEDLARTSFVLIDALGIAPEKLGDELDRLAFLGKAGSFEIADMARAFPSLGAAAREAGLVGSEGVATLGAALQLARKATGESGEAANNMKNFLAKMMAPETLRNFKKYGVSATKIMSDALKAGENPIEAMLRKIDTMIGDDQVKRKARLGALFGDMQVQDFIRPLLANMGDYKKLKQEALEKAGGTVDKDYATALSWFNQKLGGASNAVGRLGESIGRSLLPPLGAMVDIATPVIGFLANVAEFSPTATAGVTSLGAALLVGVPALSAAALGIKLVGTSIAAMGMAFKVTPIGALVTALAIGAAVIYDNWEPISAFFAKIGEGIVLGIAPAVDFLSDAANIITGPAQTLIGLGRDVVGLFGGEGLDFQNTTEAVGRTAAAYGKMAARAGLGDDAARATGGGSSPNGEVRVKVDLSNLPPGTRVETATSGQGIAPEVGMQMAMP